MPHTIFVAVDIQTIPAGTFQRKAERAGVRALACETKRTVHIQLALIHTVTLNESVSALDVGRFHWIPTHP
jgi:hypothetical protein